MGYSFEDSKIGFRQEPMLFLGNRSMNKVYTHTTQLPKKLAFLNGFRGSVGFVAQIRLRALLPNSANGHRLLPTFV